MAHKYYTRDELARVLRVSAKTISRYAHAGKFPYVKLGGKMMFLRTDIQDLLRQNGKK